jgi:hypothetical protein
VPEILFSTMSLALGWASGRTYSYLQRAGAKGKFSLQHWLTLLCSVVVAALFAKFGIGSAVRNFRINDFVVGVSSVAMLVVFAGTAFRDSLVARD